MKKIQVTGLIKINMIKEYMKRNHLTQKQFAEKCGIHIWNLQKVLDNHSDFSVVYLFKIAKTMQINLSQLIHKS